MPSEKLDLIENVLKSKNIEEYEIYLIEKAIVETIFLKNKIENEREIDDFEYFVRILTQKDDRTGIGVAKGNTLDPSQIEKIVDTSLLLSKTNSSSKYYLPANAHITPIKIADQKILDNPLAIEKDLAEELIAEATQQKDVSTTFGRFRVHDHSSFLRNSNDLNLDARKTFFIVSDFPKL